MGSGKRDLRHLDVRQVRRWATSSACDGRDGRDGRPATLTPTPGITAGQRRNHRRTAPTLLTSLTSLTRPDVAQSLTCHTSA